MIKSTPSASAEAEIAIQQSFYAATAGAYDEAHQGEGYEAVLPIMQLLAFMDALQVGSVLDVGAGTGRIVKYVQQRRPEVRVVGVEPVPEMLRQGYERGLTADDLVQGDANSLPFADGEFDLVCEFGVLHHVRTPARAVSEMLRVAKRAVLISDTNRFGQGSFLTRALKQAIGAVGLWKPFDLLNTKGRGYTISEGDGLAYSYSVFDNYRQLARECRRVHTMNTLGKGINPYRTAGHVVMVGIK